MKTVNRAVLLGNVTNAPELKVVASGRHVCSFGLATNRVWKDAKGEKQSVPDYHNVVVWGALAEFVGQHVKKGDPLYVEGYLRTHSWQTAEGVKRDRTEVIVQNLVLLGRKDPPATPAAEEEETEEAAVAA